MQDKPSQSPATFPSFEEFKHLPDTEDPLCFEGSIPGFRGQLRIQKIGHVTLSEGNLEFPSAPPGRSLELRHFNELPLIEMNFVRSGHISQKHGYHPGELTLRKGYHNVMYNCGQWEHNLFHDDGPHNTFTINLHTDRFIQLFAAHSEQLDGLLEKVVRQEPFFVDRPPLSFTPYMQSMIDSLWACPVRGSLKKLFMEIRTMELLLLQWQLFGLPLAPVGILRNRSDVEKIHFAKELLEKDLQDPPTLAELARLCGLNEFKLKKGFKEVFGATVFGHFNTLRLQRALLLLRNTDRSVTEIAYETGYAHPQHFHRAFKRQFGVAPGQMR